MPCLSTLLSLAALTAVSAAAVVPRNNDNDSRYKYVATFSVDGMHGSDVEKYVAARPKSTIAELLENGYEYQNAFTSAPSDSFPGTLAQFTGSGPRTTGVWYDDAYDRSLYAPGSMCKGPAGAEIVYTEAIDYDPNKLFSGGINPANLPMKLENGRCTPLYPHARVRVNTIFEIAQAKGLVTAYTDKHPAYDLVRGPSGKGLTLGYFPEINAADPSVNGTIEYDRLHLQAFLDWLDGKDSANSEGSLGGKMPNLFGGNFQSINVAEKQCGYENAPGNPFTPCLLSTYDFIDASMAKIVQKLKDKHIHHQTLIIIASKHGQTPINPATYEKINPDLVTNATKVEILQQTSDDIALIWLKTQKDTQTAVNNLNADRKTLEITDILSGAQLPAQGFGNPATDPAVPDIIVNPQSGVIYTTSTKKISEHGGLHDDDRHVACIVSNPNLKKTAYKQQVSTKQVGPTILTVLGLDVNSLQGAKAEGIKPLAGFTGGDDQNEE